MYKMDIVNKIKDQLIEHLAVKYEGLIEKACGIETVIRNYAIDYSQDVKSLYTELDGHISVIAYEGALACRTVPKIL